LIGPAADTHTPPSLLFAPGPRTNVEFVKDTDEAELTLNSWSYDTVVYAKLIFGAVVALDPVDRSIPPQSPALGEVAFPSPLVSPPTLSSLIEVKYTGEAEVPADVSEPLICRLAPESNLMIVPAATVRVTPAATVVLQVTS